jgi:hypothetical protein
MRRLRATGSGSGILLALSEYGPMTPRTLWLQTVVERSANERARKRDLRGCRPADASLALSPAAAGHAQRLDGQHRARLRARVQVHCARADLREHALTLNGRR